MIDIKFIRENPDAVRASQKGRGEETSIVDQLLALDETRRAAIRRAGCAALSSCQRPCSPCHGGTRRDVVRLGR